MLFYMEVTMKAEQWKAQLGEQPLGTFTPSEGKPGTRKQRRARQAQIRREMRGYRRRARAVEKAIKRGIKVVLVPEEVEGDTTEPEAPVAGPGG